MQDFSVYLIPTCISAGGKQKKRASPAFLPVESSPDARNQCQVNDFFNIFGEVRCLFKVKGGQRGSMDEPGCLLRKGRDGIRSLFPESHYKTSLSNEQKY